MAAEMKGKQTEEGAAFLAWILDPESQSDGACTYSHTNTHRYKAHTNDLKPLSDRDRGTGAG